MNDHREDHGSPPDPVEIPTPTTLADAVGLALILPPSLAVDDDRIARLQTILRAALDS
ncbi:hypothetical protein AB0I72_17990 [Nocardiopsis sp. NPDC049922]|uniref:hypothetical protein n=1 Tax=Nocardiopsis sp. NPDC049922 TaxID=3155157 RepID=UPI0033CF707A